MSLFQSQPGDIIAPGVTNALTEFAGFLGDCGQAALQILTAARDGIVPSTANLDAVVNDMIARGLASPSGVTSSQALQTELSSQGIASSVVDNWRMALGNVFQQPAELLLSNAQALPGAMAGLQGHFISVVGFSPSTNKFIVSDPASQAAKSGKFVLYSLQDIQNAMPVNALTITSPRGGGPASSQSQNTSATGYISAGPVTVQFPDFTQQISNGISSAFSKAGSGLVSGAIGTAANSVSGLFGVKNIKDLTIRTLLIFLAGAVILIGLIALVFGTSRRVYQATPPPVRSAAIGAVTA